MGESPKIPSQINLELGVKFWLEGFEDFTLGMGDVILLRSLQSTQNLTKSAEELQYSYKYAWQKLKSISKKTGLDVAVSKKGGSGGGGTVNLTDWGVYLIDRYEEIATELESIKKRINLDLKNAPFRNNNGSK